jgi:hypothetical protein
MAAGSDGPAGGEYRPIVRLERVQRFFGAIHAPRTSTALGRNEIIGLIGDTGVD